MLSQWTSVKRMPPHVSIITSTLRIMLICILILILNSSAFCKDFRVAIFDYDIRPKNEVTVAKYIEKQLRKSGLSFTEINQFTGEENDAKTLKVLTRLEEEKYDLIITITSDAMIPTLHSIKKTPVLFTNVNNPKIFGIFNLDKPGRNMSGVTYYVPIAKQLELFSKITGKKLHRIGLIFDYFAKSRRAELGEFRTIADSTGIEYKIQLIKTKEELPEVTKKLLQNKVDAIVLTSSNKIYKNVGLILDMCIAQKVPLFSVNKKGVEQGAIAAFASDYYTMVDECLIPMAMEVLEKGKNPGDMPVRSLKKPTIYLNMTVAKKLGIEISEEIKKRVKKEF